MFQNRIKDVRKGKELTQTYVAIKAGIDRSYYSKIESGKLNVSIAKLYAIAKALDCDIKELLK